MGLGHNTTIVRSGLVFYYDMSNTEKSFRGRPTTNNATNGKIDYYSRWATTTTYPALPFSKKTDVYVLSLGNNYLGGSGDFNITNGNTYTISYWYYIDTVETMYHFMGPLTSGYASASTEVTSTFVNTNNTRNVSGNINGWVWGYKTFTVNAVPTYMRGTYTDAGGFSDNDPTGKMYITNVVIESGSTPSGPYGYTGGTRSNTQAILDLTNNNTVTANSLTYNVNGTFSFNGSNNYISIPVSSILNFSPEFTLEAWINPSTYTGDIIILGQGSYYLTMNGSYQLSVYCYGKSPAGYHTTTETLSQNNWNHICASWSSTEVSLYINGLLKKSVATTGTPNSVITQVWVGSEYNGTQRSFNGSIGSTKIYNRALTATEVLQNFNAVRDRYGV